MFKPVESYVGDLIRFGEVDSEMVKCYPMEKIL